MRRRSLLLLVLFALALPGPAAEAPVARLTFTKLFKGRVPEYVRVSVAENGGAPSRGGSGLDPGELETFRVSPALTARLLALTAELGHFRGLSLESRHDVADLGRKTFVWESGGGGGGGTYTFTKNKGAGEVEQMGRGPGGGG